MHVDAQGNLQGLFCRFGLPAVQMRAMPYYCTSWAPPIRVKLMGWGW